MSVKYPKFLKVEEIASILRVSPMTVYRVIKSGELPVTRIGRSFRVAEADLDEYLKRARF